MAIRKKDGKYLYQVQYTHPITKEKKRPQKGGFKTKKEAKDAESLFIHSVQTINKKDLTFKYVATDYMEHREAYIKELSRKITSAFLTFIFTHTSMKMMLKRFQDCRFASGLIT